MIKLFQSIGIVFTLLLIIALTLIVFYATYVLGIGILLIGAVYLVYQLLRVLK